LIPNRGGDNLASRRPRQVTNAIAGDLRLSAEEHRRLSRRYRWRRHKIGYAFIAPSYFFIILVLVVPAIWVVYLSFHQGGVLDKPKFIGLANWTQILSDSIAWQAARNTLVYLFVATPLSFAAALGLAMALRRVAAGHNTLRAIIYFPTLTPYVMSALIWTFVVHPKFGILNVLLGLVGVAPVNWLGPGTSLLSVIMLEFWHGLGYWTIIFLAALVSMPEELFQAAEVDGARGVRQFWHITLPLLRPTLLFAVVMATIWNIQVFDPVLVLTDGGPAHTSETIVVYLYKQTFQFFNPGKGAATSVLLLGIILLLTVVQLRLLRRRY
jgi:ABC-type sugar transport system permease subunit